MHVAVRGFSDIEPFLEAFFGFLCTQTDFYHTQLDEVQLHRFGLDPSVNRRGFKPDHMRTLLMQIFDRNLKLYRERHQPYLLCGAAPLIPQVSLDMGTENALPTVSKQRDSKVVEKCPNSLDMHTQRGDVVSKESPPKGETTSLAPISELKQLLSTDYTITTWNGAQTDRYCWTQTFTDVTVEVVAREQLTSKDVKLNITRESLELRIRGVEIISGNFPECVNASESMWSIEDKRRIIISLDKPEEVWWDCLIQGHDKIDLTQIESVKRFSEFSTPQQSEMLKLMKQHKEKQ
ncbi:hypothetical protein X943_001189 [Babesia divergens]|uniref:Nuclear migration protein nudC n=1 Tax=Babesia divergens TaxID=32595 RepID=A0AAD9G6S3_BABDI|nr:hypothetical protein X943_001189 [Babesia divergens]